MSGSVRLVGYVRDQAKPDGFCDGLTASLHVELFIDGLCVTLDGRGCDKEPLADLFIATTKPCPLGMVRVEPLCGLS